MDGPTGICSAALSAHSWTGDAPGAGTVLTVSVEIPHAGDQSKRSRGVASDDILIAIGTSPRHPVSGFVGLSQATLAQQTINATCLMCGALMAVILLVTPRVAKPHLLGTG